MCVVEVLACVDNLFRRGSVEPRASNLRLHMVRHLAPFQASIPGSLKNVFDLLPVDAFRDKVVGILMTAGSPKYYLVTEQQLRLILTYMKAQVVQSYVFIEAKVIHLGEVNNGDVTLRIDRLIEDTVVLTRAYSHMQMEREASYAF